MGDQTNKNEADRACSTCGRERERGAYSVSVGKSEGTRPLGRPGVAGRIILKWILAKDNGGHGLD